MQAQPGAADAVASALAAAGASEERYVELINGFGARITAAGAALVAKAPGVRAVSLDAKIRKTGIVDATPAGHGVQPVDPLRQGLEERLHRQGRRRRGDRHRHRRRPARLPRLRDRLDVARDRQRRRSTPPPTNGRDTFGHGTHIAGLIAGNGTNRAAGDPQRGKYAGVAPDANLIAVKADDDDGNASVLDVIDGLQFIVDKKDDYNIRVVNLSLRATVSESYRTDPLDAAVESAWLKGIVVVVAAGNRGARPRRRLLRPGQRPVRDQRSAASTTTAPRTSATTCWPTGPAAAAPRTASRSRTSSPRARAWSRRWPPAPTTRRCARPATSTAATSGSAARRWRRPSSPATVANLLQAHPNWTPNQVKGAIIRRSRPVENQVMSDGLVVDGSGVPAPGRAPA